VRVLAGDIGGTKTSIAIAAIEGRRCRILRMERYASARYGTLEEIVAEFLSTEKSTPARAGFGVAGPVRDGKSRITNLPWRLDERQIERRNRIRRVRLLNDFGANALGLRLLGPRQLATLARGRADAGAPIAILGAGTGLGQAAILHGAGRDQIAPSEGGHVDYGPRTPLEDRLVAFLRERFGRATRERILSGSGLALLYEFLESDGYTAPGQAASAALEGAADPAAVISRFGLPRRDRLCTAALDLFVSIYGSIAGDIALQYRATGGVYVAGGIAPKILPAMKRPAFLRSFHDKPPMRELLAQIPVRVVLEPNLGLFGAAAAGAA
jgi:glucokinase